MLFYFLFFLFSLFFSLRYLKLSYYRNKLTWFKESHSFTLRNLYGVPRRCQALCLVPWETQINVFLTLISTQSRSLVGVIWKREGEEQKDVAIILEMLENLVFGDMIYFEFPLLQFGCICLIYKTNICLFLSTCEDTIMNNL